MRVVVLTQYYPPETGAPQSRWADLTRRLATRGHQVQVVTAMPNYPTGRVFPGWKHRLVASERSEGVEVLRSWLFTSPKPTTARLLATYGTFAATSVVAGIPRLGRADVLLWESPPLFLAPTAAALRRRLGARLVMNVSDLWPQSAVELGVLRGHRLRALFERWERWAYQSADLVTYQTKGIGEAVGRRAPGTAGALFPNGADTATMRRVEVGDRLKARLGLDGTGPTVGYAGNFGRSQALEQVVGAAAALAAAGAPATFVLVGDGPRKREIVRQARSLGLTNVRFADPVPSAEMAELLSLFDVAVVPLANVPLFVGARPSKMFELMAVGVPFVYCGRGEGARLAEDSGGAVIVPPEDPAALAGALRDLLRLDEAARRHRGGQARRFVVEHFDRDAIATRLERRLLDLVGPPR
jgi:colanic acid biosynthesis glycosyl transferase WcaI